MSADQDGDSQMISSPSSSDQEGTTRILTPAQPTALSPPDSQHRSAMPTSASGSAIANANGKRPLNTISNGADDADEILAMQIGANGAGIGKGVTKQEFPTKTHERSGYQWNRAEDEPGYAWLNKKALDEYHRAFDSLVHKESMVRGWSIELTLEVGERVANGAAGRYGDPFEAADKERAMINSLKQQ